MKIAIDEWPYDFAWMHLIEIAKDSNPAVHIQALLSLCVRQWRMDDFSLMVWAKEIVCPENVVSCNVIIRGKLKVHIVKLRLKRAIF